MPALLRLAHDWRMELTDEIAAGLVRDYLRPAVRAVPASLAARVKVRTIRVTPILEQPEATSRWRRAFEGAEIWLAAEGDPHDVAMELLLCVGQILWEELSSEERNQWLDRLRREMEAGVTGEIDDLALEAKNRLLADAAAARSVRRLEAYARASFASTAAEYVHCLWHDVTVRTGPEHLPARWLRARLELLQKWFPPDRGYQLFAPEPQRGTGSEGASEANPA
ncbi:MAG: hypothetical protein ACP5U2_01510 [Bryobacteraceae bacterium]